jgi:excisionase family DNA binding protein
MKPDEPVKPRLLSTKHAAIYLGVSGDTVRRLWYARKLQAISTLKHLRFDVRDLDKWIERAKEDSR